MPPSPHRRRPHCRSTARTAPWTLSTWALAALCAAAAAASAPVSSPATTSTLALPSATRGDAPAGASSGSSAGTKLNQTTTLSQGGYRGGLAVELAVTGASVDGPRTGALNEVTLAANASLPTVRVLAAQTIATARAESLDATLHESTVGVRSTGRSRASAALTAASSGASTRLDPEPTLTSNVASTESTDTPTATTTSRALPDSTGAESSTARKNSTSTRLSTSRSRTTSSSDEAVDATNSRTAQSRTIDSRTTTVLPFRTSEGASSSVSSLPSAPRTSDRTSSRTRLRSKTQSPSGTTSTPNARSSAIMSVTRLPVAVEASTELASKPSAATASQPSATAKPSPTRYGAAPKKGCVKPPSSFDGTDTGFAKLCSTRYCDATPRRNMIWSGNTGNVTRTEIETALGMLRELEPLWENGQGNVLADGWLGQGMHDAGLLYEVTGDRRALDVIVNIADNILALQNANTPGPVTIWTGAKDSVWPTADLDPEDGKLVYAGCEQGLIAGNMAAAAVFILKVPCLYDMVPPRFAGPTIFNASTTYFERAKAYIAAADDTYQSFFWRFVDSNLNLINPADERWWLTGDTRAPGTPMPWNRGTMMMHGYLRLAAAHETEAAFDADLTAHYDAISRSHISNFVKDLNQSKAIQNGVTTFSWDYSYGEDHTEESQGVHAYYDVWGAWIGWQRNSAVFGLSDFIGRTFAQTFENTISFGNGSFAGLVTGSSSTKAYTINSLFGGWSFYALWLPEWFDTIATANVEASFRGRTWLAIPLLWTKHALAINDVTFWSSRFSSGFGVIVGTEEGGGSASSPWRAGSNSGAAPTGVGAATSCTLVAAVLVALVASTWT